MSISLNKAGGSPPGKVKGGIRHRILVSTLLLTMVPLVVVGMLSLVFSARGLQEEIQAQLRMIAQMKGETLRNYFFAHENMISDVADDLAMADEVDISVLAQRHFDDLRRQNREFLAIFLVDLEHGQLVATDSESRAESLVFGRLPKSVSETVTLFYFDAAQQANLVMVSPILSRTGMAVVGRLDLAALDPLLDEAIFDGDIYLLRLEGDAFYVSGQREVPPPNLVPLLPSGVQVTASGSLPVVHYQDSQPFLFPGLGSDLADLAMWARPTRIATFFRLPLSAEAGDLFLVVDQSVAVAYRTLIVGVVFTVAVIALAILMVGGQVSATARSLADPIVQIAEATHAVASGDLRRRVFVQRDDEIGRLADDFNVMSEQLSAQLGRLEAHVQTHAQARLNLLYQFSNAVNDVVSIEEISQAAVDFVQHLTEEGEEAAIGEIFLLTDGGEVFFNSTDPTRRQASAEVRRQWVEEFVNNGLGAEVLQSGQAVIKDFGLGISDLGLGDHPQSQIPNLKSKIEIIQNPKSKIKNSLVCAPIQALARSGQAEHGEAPWEGIRGGILFWHRRPSRFGPVDVILMSTLASQIGVALQKTGLLSDVKSSLRETQLMLEVSRRLTMATQLEEIYDTLVSTVLGTGVDEAALFLCHQVDDGGVPRELTLVQGEIKGEIKNEELGIKKGEVPHSQFLIPHSQFLIPDSWREVLVSKEAAMVEIKNYECGIKKEEVPNSQFLVVPLVGRGQVLGLLVVGRRQPPTFNEREMALYRTMGNQTTLAMENARQVKRAESALLETQTLYRAGRVLAKASSLSEILEEALMEFLYSLGLNQGGVTLFSADRQMGELVAYVENGTVKVGGEKLRFAIDPNNAPYQRPLLQGQPFVSEEARHDNDLASFRSFNGEGFPFSMLQTPMMIQGQTIGWLGADAVEKPRHFSQGEIDLAKAMADQLAAAIEKARLLRQTERQLQEQATLYRIGRSVSAVLDLPLAMDSLVMETAQSLKLARCALFLLEENEEEGEIKNEELGEIKNEEVPNSQFLIVVSDFISGQSWMSGQADERLLLRDWPILAEVLQSGEMRMGEDANGRMGEDASEQPRILATSPIRPFVVLPVLVRNRVVAFLGCWADEAERRFDEHELNLLEAIAWQTATTLDSLRLYERAQQQQTFLRAIINRLPDPIFIKDRQHKLVVVNEALATFLGQAEASLVGKVDYEFLPPELGRLSLAQDGELFASTNAFSPSETELPFIDVQDRQRIITIRKSPLWVGPATGAPSYLLAIVNDVTEARAREAERDVLMARTHVTLARTQMLYRVSHILDTGQNERATFERVLGELLPILQVPWGRIFLRDRSRTDFVEQARVGEIKNYECGIKKEEVPNSQFLIPNSPNSQFLIPNSPVLRLPLLSRGEMVGLMVAGTNEANHSFGEADVEMGEAVAGQLARWLENQQLLSEAEYRAGRLTTAAEVSRVANSILNVEELIVTSVNLIRDQFNFYYVGLFLVDEAAEWAVLAAGTGEAGERMLARKHRLKVGIGMIGWSVANRQARIALDVGDDAVRFVNPDLPDTHSEMALPLMSREEVLGAISVQSVERGAFSHEDITLLQTMADQIANAIKNAHLFAQTEVALAETERLYLLTQELMSATREDGLFRLAIHALAQAGLDFCAIFLQRQDGLWEQTAIWTVSGEVPIQAGLSSSPSTLSATKATREGTFLGSLWPLLGLLPNHGETKRHDRLASANLSPAMESELARLGLGSWLMVPLSTPQMLLGFLLVGFSEPNQLFSPSQVRFFSTLAQQMVVALENLRLLAETQRRARREEIIREISNKIRSSTKLDEILKITVSELGKVVGASQGNIRLNVN